MQRALWLIVLARARSALCQLRGGGGRNHYYSVLYTRQTISRYWSRSLRTFFRVLFFEYARTRITKHLAFTLLFGHFLSSTATHTTHTHSNDCCVPAPTRSRTPCAHETTRPDARASVYPFILYTHTHIHTHENALCILRRRWSGRRRATT